MTSPLENNNTLRSKKRESLPDPIPIEDGRHLLIPLTRGYFAKIDVADLPLIGTHCWNANERDGKMYAQQVIGRGGSSIYMHRVIMGVTDPSILVDHRNREDTLNNTRENLRVSGKDQNAFNSKIRSDCTTGFKGVMKQPKSYVPYLNYKGIRVHLGRCSDPVEAARIRDRAALEVHGEFASLNFNPLDYVDLPTIGYMRVIEAELSSSDCKSITFENGILVGRGRRGGNLQG